MVLSDRALARLDPIASGWTGALDAGLFDDDVHPVADGAAGWSLTNLSPIAAGALAHALELVELAGVRAIGDRIATRLDELTEAILAAGGEVVSAQERRAGILAFRVPEHPASVVGAALVEAGVTATVRPEHIRLTPHASTTPETIARFATALRAVRPEPVAAQRIEQQPAGGSDVLSALVPTVNSLAAALGPGTEVLLHDLSALPNSIVAIAGDLTGRQVGGPMTDLLLGLVRRGSTQDLTNYETYAPDGRVIRSSTVFLRDADGVAVGCLCVNSDQGLSGRAERVVEAFPGDVDTLQRLLVERAVADVAVPVELMKKSHKSQVVKVLDDAGYFLIKDSVDHLAGALDVTRYTIYNYLNEIRGPAKTTGSLSAKPTI
jgi:predicted transcriptional regulator YheO